MRNVFARVTTSQAQPDLSPEDRDRMTDFILEQLIPAVRRMDGFKGGYWLGDPKSGKGLTFTLWESEEAERASQAASSQLRQQAASALSAEIKGVEVYEVLAHI